MSSSIQDLKPDKNEMGMCLPDLHQTEGASWKLLSEWCQSTWWKKIKLHEKNVGFFGMLNRNSQVASNRKHIKMFKVERMYYFMMCRHYRPEAICSSNKTLYCFASWSAFDNVTQFLALDYGRKMSVSSAWTVSLQLQSQWHLASTLSF